MILYHLELATTPDQHDAFLHLLNRTMNKCRDEKGCLLYRFTKDLGEPHRFFLDEWWENEPSLLAHTAGEAFRAFIDELPGCGRIVSSVAYHGELTLYTRPTS